MLMSVRTLVLFVGSLLAATWAVQIAGLVIVGDMGSPAMVPYFIAGMFMPTIWSLGYLTLFNRSAWKLVRFWPGNPLYLVLGALIPALSAFAVLGVSMAMHWGGSHFFTFSAAGADVLRGPWVLGLGEQGWAMFAANVAGTAIMFAVFNSQVAIGEEFGWRGVLQHHMIGRFGFYRGVALLGFIWAMWHAPLNLAGYNHPDMPLLGAFVLFPLQLIAGSFIMAFLTLRARSFWPAVLAHGSTNGIEAGVLSSIQAGESVHPLALEAAGFAVTLVVALVCVLATPRAQQGGATGAAAATA